MFASLFGCSAHSGLPEACHQRMSMVAEYENVHGKEAASKEAWAGMGWGLLLFVIVGPYLLWRWVWFEGVLMWLAKLVCMLVV